MVDGISKETPESDWQEPTASTSQFAPDSDEVEPAFRPEWTAQLVSFSNDSVIHADGAKDSSAAPSSDTWPTDINIVAIDQYSNVGGSSEDSSLWQFFEHLHAAPVAWAKQPVDGSDSTATGGSHDDAQPGSALGGTDLNAHAISLPAGSSTPPSIVMGISTLATAYGDGVTETGFTWSQGWLTTSNSGIANIPTPVFAPDSASPSGPVSSTFGDLIQPADLHTPPALLTHSAEGPPNSAPVVTINHPFSPTGEWSNVGGWVSYSDPNGDPAVQYQFRDDGLAPNSAYLSIPSNAHVPDGTTLTVAASDLGNVLVHSGDPNTSDTMWVRASDGNNWSAWAEIDFATTASNQAYGADLIFVVNSSPVAVMWGDVPTFAIASPNPDVFIFNQHSSTSTAISHFDPSQDTIQFEGTSLTDFAAVLSHTNDDGHGSAVIAYDAHHTVTLEGVAPAVLHPSNFDIV